MYKYTCPSEITLHLYTVSLILQLDSNGQNLFVAQSHIFNSTFFISIFHLLIYIPTFVLFMLIYLFRFDYRDFVYHFPL
uniref:Uncharacterized protein n=1 Tax=Octopus bimaculoides TaxID=37653 RepID=A0A0L8GHA9_OCTBM